MFPSKIMKAGKQNKLAHFINSKTFKYAKKIYMRRNNNTLKSGIYAYLLKVDGRVSETKQMILTK